MDKLPEQKKFFDVSDYSRPFARIFVSKIKDYKVTPIFFTSISFLCGIFASVLVYNNQFRIISAILILLKSFFDAVDGELARAKNRPSYVGRFYDSVVDFVVNFLILLALTLRFNESIFNFFLVLILFHLQGSIYNFYYVMKRHKVGGDLTSHIDETKIELIYPYDNPFWFKVFHKLYIFIYSWQDKLIYKLDRQVELLRDIPQKFMTLVSFLGLGTQLLIIAFLILIKKESLILDFFIFYSILGFFVILIRKIFWNK